MADNDTGPRDENDGPVSHRYLTTFGIEDRWAPLSGRHPGGTPPVALRRRWLAALGCSILLALALYLLS